VFHCIILPVVLSVLTLLPLLPLPLFLILILIFLFKLTALFYPLKDVLGCPERPPQIKYIIIIIIIIIVSKNVDGNNNNNYNQLITTPIQEAILLNPPKTFCFLHYVQPIFDDALKAFEDAEIGDPNE